MHINDLSRPENSWNTVRQTPAKNQASQLGKLRASQTIGIFSKLRYNTSLPILRIIYLDLDHIYNMTLMCRSKKIMQLKIIYRNWRTKPSETLPFKELHDPVNPLNKDLKILKLKYLIHPPNQLLVSHIEKNETPAKSFATLKHYNHNAVITITTKCELPVKELWALPSIRQTLVVLILQNIRFFQIAEGVGGSEILLGGIFLPDGENMRSDLMIQTFFKAKDSIL